MSISIDPQPPPLERDPDSGAVGARDFDRLVDWELERAERERLPVTVVALSAVRLGENAAPDPQGASEFLRQVLRILRDQTREGDVIGRGSGTTFWLLLPRTPAEQGLFLVEDMRRLLANSTVRLAGSGPDGLRISLSAGLAGFPKDGADGETLRRKAADALFRAGRDRVCLALDEKMVLKSNYYPKSQLQRLAGLATALGRTEASLLREALDDLFQKLPRGS